MPGETEKEPSPWTIDSSMQLLKSTINERDRLYVELRAADQMFAEERDRRYSEVNVEKEKALKIKETADLAALQLAREIQTYKDEKANELREQINRERGLYVTKDELISATRELTAIIAPLTQYVSLQQGRASTFKDSGGFIVGAVGVIAAVIAIVYAVAGG